jgi:hypothetical protein
LGSLGDDNGNGDASVEACRDGRGIVEARFVRGDEDEDGNVGRKEKASRIDVHI